MAAARGRRGVVRDEDVRLVVGQYRGRSRWRGAKGAQDLPRVGDVLTGLCGGDCLASKRRALALCPGICSGSGVVTGRGSVAGYLSSPLHMTQMSSLSVRPTIQWCSFLAFLSELQSSSGTHSYE